MNVLASNGGSGGGGGSWFPNNPEATNNTTPGISTNSLGGNSGGYGHTILDLDYIGGAGGGGGSGTAGSDGTYGIGWGYGQGVRYNNEGIIGGYGGNGGNGTDLFASWVSAISSDMDPEWQNVTSQGYIAAGGGGSSHGTRIGSGGLGGGGSGGSNHSKFWNNGFYFLDYNPADGITNTGSGGGGAAFVNWGIWKLGGNGGSGLVIIRVPLLQVQ